MKHISRLITTVVAALALAATLAAPALAGANAPINGGSRAYINAGALAKIYGTNLNIGGDVAYKVALSSAPSVQVCYTTCKAATVYGWSSDSTSPYMDATYDAQFPAVKAGARISYTVKVTSSAGNATWTFVNVQVAAD